jgi:hypothetical protein
MLSVERDEVSQPLCWEIQVFSQPLPLAEYVLAMFKRPPRLKYFIMEEQII